MKTYSHTFTAGETITLPGGVHFEILSGTDSLDVTYFARDGQPLDEVAEGVPAGYYYTAPREQELVLRGGRQFIVERANGFATAQVYSATAQTVLIGITRGDGGARSTATNITSGRLTPKTLVTSYFAGVTSTLVTIVTPAANSNGVRIDGITWSVDSSTLSVRSHLLSKTSAPASYNDKSARLLSAFFWDNSATALLHTSQREFPFIVPAGEGLYTQASAANGGSIGIDYEVL